MAYTIPGLRSNRHYSSGQNSPSYITGNPLDDIVLFKASSVKTILLKDSMQKIRIKNVVKRYQKLTHVCL
jgi:hypothetical protein